MRVRKHDAGLAVRPVFIVSSLLAALITGCGPDKQSNGTGDGAQRTATSIPAASAGVGIDGPGHTSPNHVAATVLGNELRTDDATEMQAAILDALFEQYEADSGIRAEDSEIDAFIARLDRSKEADIAAKRERLAEIDDLLGAVNLSGDERDALEKERDLIADTVDDLESSEDLSAGEAAEVTDMRRAFAREMILHWKVDRALYEQYGGRLIAQQLGPEPLDAYRQFLEDRREAGAFDIRCPDMEEAFWRYFTDETKHSYLDADSDAVASAFASPPWTE